MSAFRVSVPGNLLLAGEYAVLEEGGLGAALAVEPRLTVTVFPQDDWELVGRWPGGGETWTPGQKEPTFAGQVFLRAWELLESRGDERQRRWSHRLRPARLEVDSSAFFDPQGRKRGFGSSAALAVGVTAALARLGERDDPASAHLTAVAAHRYAQGGAGSGYDVTVSWFGGWGLFVGGVEPRWEAATSALPTLAVFPGPDAVRTPGAIARYHRWKAENQDSAQEFLEANNRIVRAMVTARTPTAFLAAWSQARDQGLAIGRAVGSEASLEVPPGLAPETFVKALGAGNETGVAAWPEAPESLRPPLVALTPSPEGLRWE